MRRVFLLILLLAVSGCAHEGISKESMNLVNPSLSFPFLRVNPDQAIGSYVYLGGIIAKVNNYPEGGELEIVQQPLSRSGKPETDSPSQGRFFARSTSFLDPLIHKPGLRISLVGEVKGHAVRSLDNVQYRYPVVLIKEHHLWQPEEQTSQPSVHFGVGVGFGL